MLYNVIPSPCPIKKRTYRAMFVYQAGFVKLNTSAVLHCVWQVKVWFQNRRMKWKRTKGSQMARDKVTGQLKPVTTEPPAHLPEMEQLMMKAKPRLTWRHWDVDCGMVIKTSLTIKLAKMQAPAVYISHWDCCFTTHGTKLCFYHELLHFVIHLTVLVFALVRNFLQLTLFVFWAMCPSAHSSDHEQVLPERPSAARKRGPPG